MQPADVSAGRVVSGPIIPLPLRCRLPTTHLQPRVHWLAFQSENTDHALMHPPQRLLPREPLQAFHAQRELAQRQRSLPAQTSVSQSNQVFLRGVVRPVDDAEILAAP